MATEEELEAKRREAEDRDPTDDDLDDDEESGDGDDEDGGPRRTARQRKRRRRRRERRKLKAELGIEGGLGPTPIPEGPRDLTVRVRDLHVEYEIIAERRQALRQSFVERQRVQHVVVRAVRGVSFDLYEGDAVGVVGSNGSGKSTLLAAIGGLLPASSGEILVSDEPLLLGVGAALLPEAPGSRNVRLGLLALGLTPDEADDLAPEVVEFSELGEAIDRPLRTYSSGMRARLLFSITTAVRPRILLVDEALSVGDRRFRLKSRARMQEVLQNAGTLMLVSHSQREIRKVCNRCIWIEEGQLRADGPVDEVLEQYGLDDE